MFFRTHLHRAMASLALAIACVLATLHASADEPSKRFSVSPAGQGTLVFHRSRAADGQFEGLVVDSRQLVETLKARVLEARGLGEVAELNEASYGSLPSRRTAPEETEAAFLFAHQFASPFDSVDASLRLRPLAEPGEGALLVPLTLLFGATLVLGLYALYRMTATQIEFAERRNDFVSAVSHELKTPLTAIRMYAEMLEEDLIPDETRRRSYYRTITAESERLTRLINNVLELSRVERRPASLNLMLGDVTPVLREALAVLGPHIEHEGFQLDFEVASPLPAVYFEADALKQVLFNLIDNALKYSREAPEKRITVRCETSAPGHVVLSVRDRGPGVQREHLNTIFQPFFRGERELTRKNQGTGIGLSLVRGLVERMGGSVRGYNATPGLEIRVELAPG